MTRAVRPRTLRRIASRERQRGYLGLNSYRRLAASALSGPVFFSQLTTSLVPDKAAPGTAPTFTRATTKTFTDWEGVVRTALSGEACFTGARRVRNLCATGGSTENLTAAPWGSASGGTGAVATCTAGFTAPDGTATAFRVQANRGAGVTASDQSGWNDGGFTSLNGQQIRNSIWIKSNTGANQNVAIRLTAIDANATMVATPQWQRVAEAAPKTATGGAFSAAFIGTRGTFADQVIDVLVWHPQVEDVTGQSNQNPAEYVSVGVLSAPYQGANVDGVQYFATQNGNTVASNVVTAGNGAAIPSSVLLGYSAWQASTNLCLQSEDLTTTWVGTNATVTANTTVSPAGTTTADSIVATAASGNVNQSFTKAASALAYTLSTYVKPGTVNIVRLQLGDTSAFTNAVVAEFNAATGVISLAAAAVGAGWTAPSATITLSANGFYRLTLTGTSTTVTTLAASVGHNAAAVNTNTIIAWGHQLEQNAFVTPYIATTTAAVTRNADVLSYPSAGFTNGVALYGELVPTDLVNGNAYAIALQVGSNANPTASLRKPAASYSFVARDGVGGVHDATGLSAPVVNGLAKFGASITAAGATSAAINGGLGSAPGSGMTGLDQITQLNVGVGYGTGWFNGTIRNVKVWTRALADAELVQATS